MGLVVWILCWMIFLILCSYLLPSFCGGCLCKGASSGTGGVLCVLEDVSNTMFFMFPSICCGSVGSGRSSGSLGLDCVLEDVFNTVFFVA